MKKMILLIMICLCHTTFLICSCKLEIDIPTYVDRLLEQEAYLTLMTKYEKPSTLTARKTKFNRANHQIISLMSPDQKTAYSLELDQRIAKFQKTQVTANQLAWLTLPAIPGHPSTKPTKNKPAKHKCCIIS